MNETKSPDSVSLTPTLLARKQDSSCPSSTLSWNGRQGKTIRHEQGQEETLGENDGKETQAACSSTDCSGKRAMLRDNLQVVGQSIDIVVRYQEWFYSSLNKVPTNLTPRPIYKMRLVFQNESSVLRKTCADKNKGRDLDFYGYSVEDIARYSCDIARTYCIVSFILYEPFVQINTTQVPKLFLITYLQSTFYSFDDIEPWLMYTFNALFKVLVVTYRIFMWKWQLNLSLSWSLRGNIVRFKHNLKPFIIGSSSNDSDFLSGTERIFHVTY
jgi:hypothetical protein